MNYKEFMNNLLDKNTKGIYLIDSEEKFLSDSIIETTKSLVSIPDFNYIEIKGLCDFETIKTAYETYPVMEEKKYIVWKNIDLSKNSIKDYEEILANISKDLENFPTYANFLIFSDNRPFKGKFYKKIEKYANIVRIERLSKKDLETFIGRRFVRNNKKIQKSMIGEIIDRFSYLQKDSEIDLYEVVNTIDKIIANSTDEIIKIEDVRSQLDEILNLNIFNLTDAISMRNAKSATEIYLKMSEKDDDLFMIFHMIIRQNRNLIAFKTLKINGKNDSFIMKSISIGTYELKKLREFENNFTLDDLFSAHKRLFDMEIRQKSQDFDMKRETLIFINKICN